MQKLNESDKDRIFEYLKKEPEMNLFFIGDMENYGLGGENVSIFAFEKDNEWDCVLLKFYDFYVLYSQKEQYDAAAVADFLKGKEVDCISGKTSLVEQMHPYYPNLQLEPTFMCRCDGTSLSALEEKDFEQAEKSNKINVRALQVEDLEQIMQLYLQIEEFAATYKEPEKARERQRAELEKGELGIGIFEHDKLAAVAMASASNSVGAMIVGVATAPDRRNRGYASRAVLELCRQSFAGGKSFLCLFYNNPEAGRIYQKIGFREVGSYAMMR